MMAKFVRLVVDAEQIFTMKQYRMLIAKLEDVAVRTTKKAKMTTPGSNSTISSGGDNPTDNVLKRAWLAYQAGNLLCNYKAYGLGNSVYIGAAVNFEMQHRIKPIIGCPSVNGPPGTDKHFSVCNM